jgi:PKD repeat protein
VIVPTCNASYTYTTDSLGNVTFTASPVTPGLDYSWDYGDFSFPDNGPVVTHQFPFTGVYNVCLTVSDFMSGCTSTFCDSVPVTVPVNCSATFTAFPLNQSVTLLVQGMNPGMVYTIDFGDGTTGVPNGFGFIQHNYAAGGTYNVCLNVVDPASGCTSQFCQTVTVTGCPVTAAFTITNLINGQVFLDATTQGFQYMHNWAVLTAPDDTIISALNRDTLTYTFTTNGNKGVCLLVFDLLNTACRDSLCKFFSVSGIGVEEYEALNSSITIYPNPSKDHIALNFTLLKNEEVMIRITDLSGKIVYETAKELLSSGEQKASVNVSMLASGTYILQLNAGGNVVNRKFTKN